MTKGKTGMLAAAAIGVFSLVVPAVAQDAGSTSARDDAVRDLPTWEPYGASNADTVEETFFRLAQDFVTTSELGVSRLGHVPIWPRGDMKIGNVRVLPYFREAIEYDSNLFKENQAGARDLPSSDGRDGRESGWTQVHQLGFLADTMLMGGRLRLSLSTDQQWRERYREDHPSDWEGSAQLGARYTFNRNVWASAGFSYARRSEPIENQFESRFKRTNQGAFASVGLDGDPFFGTKLNYILRIDSRDAESRDPSFDDLDRTETTYSFEANYPVWRETTRAFARARYRADNRESQRINDGDVSGFDFGIKGSIPLTVTDGVSGGLRGTLSVGFDHAEYESGGFTDSGVAFRRDDGDDDTSLHVEASLQYLMSSRSVADLRYLRTNQFSFRGNYQIVDRVDFTLTHNITRRLVGRVATYYEHTSPTGTLIPLRADGSAQLLNQHNRNVNRGGVGLGLRYPIEDWVDLDVSVDYERRNSAHESSFTNYRGVVGLTFYLSGLKVPTFGSGIE